MIGESGLDGGRSLEAKDRTQEKVALQQDQDQGGGPLEEPKAKATTEPEIDTMEAPNRRPPIVSPSSPPPTLGPSIQPLGQQQLLSRNEAELRGEGCQGEWTTTFRRIIARFLVPGNYLLSTTVGLFLQRKHPTSAEYETIDAKEQRATTELELCPFRVHLRSLGPDEGATSRTPFMPTCP